MNNRQTNNIDGFVLRRRVQEGRDPRKLGSGPLIVPERFTSQESLPKIQTRRDEVPATAPVPLSQPMPSGLRRSEIDASLADIDETPGQDLGKRPRRLSRRGLKRIFIVLMLLLFIIGGYLGVKFLVASGRVFNGNLFDLLGTGKELTTDEFGRTNILLFGNSEDSVAHQEQGSGELTDSIMVISIEQKTKNAVMFSIPRDLWVKYGEACASGYEGRINVVYMCGKDGASQEQGAQKLMDIVGTTFDIDLQYYAQVNYTALKEAVNAVGGITVEIDSDDPRGVYDPNFDWQCNYRCKMVKYPNGPVQLDGEHALALARARNAAGGYGLGGGNFDREKYQQKIIIALKEKATAAGTLSNPVKVGGLIDTLGNNVKTNFDTAEVKTLIGLANDINTESIKRLSLIDEAHQIMTTGNYQGQSIVRPVEGIYNFSEVRSFIRSQLTNNVSSEEDAVVEVLNGGDTPGLAGNMAEELAAEGIVVSKTGDTPTDPSYGKVKWYNLSGDDKSKTAQKLEEVLGEPSSGHELPDGVQSEADFVIIVGDGAN